MSLQGVRVVILLEQSLYSPHQPLNWFEGIWESYLCGKSHIWQELLE